jgi:chorismate mutase
MEKAAEVVLHELLAEIEEGKNMNPIHVFKVAVTVTSDSDTSAIKVGAVMKYLLENGSILEVIDIQPQTTIGNERVNS